MQQCVAHSGSPHDNEASDLYWNAMNCELHYWHMGHMLMCEVTICKLPHATTSILHLDAFSPGRMGEEG